MYAVELDGVSQVYVNRKGAFVALQDVQLAIAPGEFVSLIGPSNSRPIEAFSKIVRQGNK
ncbi:hypothetical protein QJ48_08790 [Paenibacillus sp. A3]|uniref:hypothetical protein n=1 Tax=Paenibacillus sp. A3 TaxID=1337054 RepID=UPI0006D559B9|nr:hypothetical protein [Paenibacillus sp. A3]KPV59858.1 hypothetical protein QJ48_08790 [Paenibacillus sp. A3]